MNSWMCLVSVSVMMTRYSSLLTVSVEILLTVIIYLALWCPKLDVCRTFFITGISFEVDFVVVTCIKSFFLLSFIIQCICILLVRWLEVYPACKIVLPFNSQQFTLGIILTWSNSPKGWIKQKLNHCVKWTFRNVTLHFLYRGKHVPRVRWQFLQLCSWFGLGFLLAAASDLMSGFDLRVSK